MSGKGHFASMAQHRLPAHGSGGLIDIKSLIQSIQQSEQHQIRSVRMLLHPHLNQSKSHRYIVQGWRGADLGWMYCTNGMGSTCPRRIRPCMSGWRDIRIRIYSIRDIICRRRPANDIYVRCRVSLMRGTCFGAKRGSTDD